MSDWWKPEIYAARKPYLAVRMALIRAVRGFFESRDYWEVETPALQVSPCMDARIRAFATQLTSVDRQSVQIMHLHTSPEIAMKKLLVAGLPKIFQLCRVFRNAEGASTHEPEFTMLEWYATGMDYRALMQECVDFVRYCAKELKIDEFKWRGRESDPFAEWEIISVADAFKKYADIDLAAVLGDYDAFAAEAERVGIKPHDGDGWDDLFFRVFLEKIEKKLGSPAPTIIYDYPASMASLSRINPDDPRYCERFEIYICGLELANAFGELTDPAEQRQRFIDENKTREADHGDTYPVDTEFLDALEYGMPEASGIALGIDRLAMIFSGADNIEQVIWTPVRPPEEVLPSSVRLAGS